MGHYCHAALQREREKPSWDHRVNFLPIAESTKHYEQHHAAILTLPHTQAGETCRPATFKNRRVTGISFIFVPASVISLPDKLSLHTPPVWHQLTKIRSHLKSFLLTCPRRTSEGANPFAVSTYCRPQDFGRAVSPPSERLQPYRQLYRRA